MESCRIYGSSPYAIAVIHGGPGAPGSVALLAQDLAADYGVLEPLQSRQTLWGPDGQVEELRADLEQHADLPATLVGHSWGAMLAWCLAATHPSCVKKLILVASGLFDDRLAGSIMRTRLDRLSPEKRSELTRFFEAMVRAVNPVERNRLFGEAAALLMEADTYESTMLDSQRNATLALQYDLHMKIWAEMSRLRSSGRLIELGKDISCPVVAIHGEYDPHPAAGIEEPLRTVLNEFRFHRIPRCGHYPWLERYGREPFYEALRGELHD